MTCIPMPSTGFIIPPDTGLSDGAPNVADRWLRYRMTDHSITRGMEATDLLGQIDNVAATASVHNWDGEGSAPVQPSTVMFARLFAAALPAQLPAPIVSADRDGDIAFDWDSGPRSVFSISVARDGVLNYAGLFGPSRRHGSDVIFSGLRSEIIQNIKQASGQTD